MSGYVIDIGQDRPSDGEFEAPSEALVAVIDSTQRTVEGLVTIGEIVAVTGERAAASEVYDAVVEMVRSIEPGVSTRFEDDGQLVTFVRGAVVVYGTRVGVVAEHVVSHMGADDDVETSVRDALGLAAIIDAASLPGFPTTDSGYRWFRCPNGHRHHLRATSEGRPCPSCDGVLEQDD